MPVALSLFHDHGITSKDIRNPMSLTVPSDHRLNGGKHEQFGVLIIVDGGLLARGKIHTRQYKYSKAYDVGMKKLTRLLHVKCDVF